ncbi:triose-phosphate isomerase [Acetobacter sacchari]|uniref:Triosephosphate isomerase n=1 Tax=Acetobacter sacchari TaxID=2661687 RepID=A0ABS3LRG3_9PROT|nr:triose-phosphate isomerase [Acetobacter sacchari]MBO1358488.1 triose-phosphate isomerase [Acetobacter sacchari]
MSKHPFWVGTSWKMNKTLPEAEDFCSELRKRFPHRDDGIQRFIIPPFTMVRDVKHMIADLPVKVGAQNMHWEDSGAWTGEISPPMLIDCGLDLVELGHSERRAHFGETDETVGLKVAAALAHGLTPLICIGETAEDKSNGRADSVLEREVRAALRHVAAKEASTILLAYEPVWAIGERGTPASADYADARHKHISTVAEDCLGRKLPCLYGGSVNPKNCRELASCSHIDGLFIGRSAWDAVGYCDILDRVSGVL